MQRSNARILAVMILSVIGLGTVGISPTEVQAQGPQGSYQGIGFAGEYYSNRTIFLRARTYLPDTGRFLQRDPLDWGNSFEPQRSNRYYYTNRPVDAIDPSGYTSIDFSGLPDYSGFPLGTELGSGIHKTGYLIQGAGDVGPQVISILHPSIDPSEGLNILRSEQQALNLLDSYGVPILKSEIGTYNGRLAIMNDELLLHSRMPHPNYYGSRAFEDPNWLGKHPIITRSALESLQRSGQMLMDNGLDCIDLQGGFALNGPRKGEWLINDLMRARQVSGIRPISTQVAQARIEQQVKSALGMRARTPMAFTGTAVDIVFQVEGLLSLAVDTKNDPRYANDPQPLPKKMLDKLNNDLNCMMFGPCLYPTPPDMTVHQ